MKEDSGDVNYCINLAIDNAKKRIKLLEERDQKCILEEYKAVSYTHLTLPTKRIV